MSREYLDALAEAADHVEAGVQLFAEAGHEELFEAQLEVFEEGEGVRQAVVVDQVDEQDAEGLGDEGVCVCGEGFFFDGFEGGVRAEDGAALLAGAHLPDDVDEVHLLEDVVEVLAVQLEALRVVAELLACLVEPGRLIAHLDQRLEGADLGHRVARSEQASEQLLALCAGEQEVQRAVRRQRTGHLVQPRLRWRATWRP